LLYDAKGETELENFPAFLSVIYHFYERLKTLDDFAQPDVLKKLEQTLFKIEKGISRCERAHFKIKRKFKIYFENIQIEKKCLGIENN